MKNVQLCTLGWRAAMSVHHKLAVKYIQSSCGQPHAHCKCIGNHNIFVPPPTEIVLKCICVDFKGLPIGTNFILIDHCFGKLLSINKVSSEHKQTMVQSFPFLSFCSNCIWSITNSLVWGLLRFTPINLFSV